MSIQSRGAHVVKAVVADLEGMGYREIVMKADQGPVKKALRLRVKRNWSGEVIPQYSPVGQSASNGGVEKAIQEVETQMKVML